MIAEKGWNQTDLAFKLGITPQAVQQWLRNEKPTTPSQARLRKISEISGYPIHWFQ